MIHDYIAQNNTCFVEWLECLGAIGGAWKCFSAWEQVILLVGELVGGEIVRWRVSPTAFSGNKSRGILCKYRYRNSCPAGIPAKNSCDSG